MTSKCESCLIDAGRVNKGLYCCQIRSLSKIPRHARQVHYDRVFIEEGRGALEMLMRDVSAEYHRLQAYHAARKENR
jgi:hypothetical protein